jgi:hypothetical protein
MIKSLRLFLFCLLAGSLPAAEIVLPGDNFFPGWKRSGPPVTFVKADLFNHIDGGAELFLEFGFEKVAIQHYKKGSAELTLEVYEMELPESALGVYLMKCGRETPFPEIPARNSSEATQATILRGTHFLLVNNFSGGAELQPAMIALSKSVLAKIPDVPASGRLFEMLPSKDRLAGSERLVRGPVVLQPYFTFGEGDILQLEGKIFGAVANYREVPEAVYTRFVIPYPDEVRAVSVYKNLLANLDPYLKVLETKETAFVFEDYREKFGLVELKGSTLDIRVNLSLRPKI